MLAQNILSALIIVVEASFFAFTMVREANRLCAWLERNQGMQPDADPECLPVHYFDLLDEVETLDEVKVPAVRMPLLLAPAKEVVVGLLAPAKEDLPLQPEEVEFLAMAIYLLDSPEKKAKYDAILIEEGRNPSELEAVWAELQEMVNSVTPVTPETIPTTDVLITLKQYKHNGHPVVIESSIPFTVPADIKRYSYKKQPAIRFSSLVAWVNSSNR